jgi:prevent-host-death family protein
MAETANLKHWTMTQAKANLEVIIDAAHANGPQVITFRGVPHAVVVSMPEWQSLERLNRPFQAPRSEPIQK